MTPCRAATPACSGFTIVPMFSLRPQASDAAMDSERPAADLTRVIADFGSRWEILDTGISVKLYPSCAATHPPLDALLQLVRSHGFTAEDVEAIDVEVDSMTPRLLIYDRPVTELEAKFSMPFCAAAAIVFGHPTIDTFAVDRIGDARIQQIIPRVTLRTNTAFDAAAPLSRARVTVRLRDGRTFTGDADGARGYPGRLTDAELTAKFLGCAERSLSRRAARLALPALRAIDTAPKVTTLTALCAAGRD